MIDANKHTYSISAMCKLLNISRQTYYYKTKKKPSEAALEAAVTEEFNRSRKNYGTRKIKAALAKRDILVSRRKISQIMNRRGLKSNYTKANYRKHTSNVNHSDIGNTLDRAFTEREPLEAIITDLTYVRAGTTWCYVCFIIDLFNREIIGHSCGPNKDAPLVKSAFQTISHPLTEVKIFHTDRGKEFDNKLIDTILETFDIERSLSKKGCPYDNAVAESTYKSFKVEFVYPNTFDTLNQLKLQLFDYVNWWNYLRLHGSLGYETPIGIRNLRLAERILDNEHGCGSVA